MFGLEKKRKKPFEFDLEKELKADTQKRSKILEDVAARKEKLKALIREGAKSEEFEQCGLLLQGYEALEQVIDTIEKE